MRPTEKLNTEMLKYHRERAGFTQEKLAEIALVKSEGYSEKSRLRTYQKIEEKGKTSRKGAHLIAKALGVSVSDLQNPNIQDRKVKLVELMKGAVKKMQEANDEDGLVRIAQVLGFQQEDSQDEWDTVCDKEYAVLSDKIECLHLFGEAGELESFAKIFGVTAHELRPAPLESFWLFSSSNPFGNCHSLGKLVSGYAGVLAEIKENWEALPDAFCRYPEAITATVTATVSKEGMRYRLCFKTSSTFKFTCLFYACAMTEKGLPSINASKRDQDELMRLLKSFLFDHAFTVVINGEQFPPENSSGVFQVRFFDMLENNNPVELGTRIYNHRLPLHYSLKPLLENQHADHYVSLAIPMDVFCFPGILMWLYENQRNSKYYEISFGWLGGAGEFHEGPWPKIFREKFIKELNDRPVLNLHEIRTLPEDDVIPPFEPEQQSSASEGVAV
jgi:transcriptional regulator with XRE-family HTH domain